MLRSVPMVALVVALAIPPVLARAQPTSTDDDLQQQAKAVWKRGAQKYKLAKWDDAIQLFEEAYETWPYPQILFNLCQAHRQKKSYERAIFFCRAYLRDVPEAKNREQVVGLIAEMQDLSTQQAAMSERPPEGVETPPTDETDRDHEVGSPPSVEPAPRAASSPETHIEPARPRMAARVTAPEVGSSRWYHDPWGWAIAGAGFATVAVGGGFLINASNLEAEGKRNQDPLAAGRLFDKSDSRGTTGRALIVVGGIALAVGVIKLAVRPDSSTTRVADAVVFDVHIAPGAALWATVAGLRHPLISRRAAA